MDEITHVVERLLDMSYEERVASPCIGPERADLVLAGCAILEAIRRALPCARLRVADRGLREGMLVQMMREDGVWRAARRHGRLRARLTQQHGGGPQQGAGGGQRSCKVRLKTAASAGRPRSSGSSASSTTPMSRAPSAKAIARAPPSS